MDTPTEIGLVAVALVALIAFRWFVLRAAVQNPRAKGRLQSALPMILPPLVAGGPLFIAIAAASYPVESPEVSPFLVYAAFGGGIALSVGLAAMVSMLMTQQRQISRLTALVAPEPDEKS